MRGRFAWRSFYCRAVPLAVTVKLALAPYVSVDVIVGWVVIEGAVQGFEITKLLLVAVVNAGVVV